jgi:hypothetical protein
MPIAAFTRAWKKLCVFAHDVIFFQIDLAFTKNNPFRANVMALASTAASFQLGQNINYAASGEYVLAIFRHTCGLHESHAQCGEDVKAVLINLLHAARYRGLDVEYLLDRAKWMFDEEVRDELDEVGDVLEKSR